MKILMLAPKYEPDVESKGRPYYLPLGIMYVASYLKKHGCNVHSLNLNHYPDEKLEEVLSHETFDAIGVGGLFTEIVPITTCIETTRRVQPKAKVILGGAIATGDPQYALETLRPDFLVLGEGEETCLELVRALENPSNLEDVKGIAYFRNGQYFQTACRTELIADLDNLPSPDYEGFEVSHFLDHHGVNDEILSTVMDNKNRRVMGVIASRDCAAKCTFCFRLMSGGYRLRSVDVVVAELKYLMEKYGVNEVFFADEMFAIKKQRVYDLCEKIKLLNLRWKVQLRVPTVDKDVLVAMKEAGCYEVSYGLESGSKSVLKSMKKGIRLEQVENAIRWTSEVGMTIQGNFIFGDPAETLDTMRETIQFRRKFPTINFGWGLILPYPGTVLYNDLKREGKFTNLHEFYKSPAEVFGRYPLNMTQMSPNDFKLMCRTVWRESVLNFVSGKVLKKRKLAPPYFLVTAKCLNCGEIVHDIKVNSRGKLKYVCTKCYQRIGFLKSQLAFAFYERLRQFYHHRVLGFLLASPRVHRIFDPLITLLEGKGKIGGMLKEALKG